MTLSMPYRSMMPTASSALSLAGPLTVKPAQQPVFSSVRAAVSSVAWSITMRSCVTCSSSIIDITRSMHFFPLWLAERTVTGRKRSSAMRSWRLRASSSSGVARSRPTSPMPMTEGLSRKGSIALSTSRAIGLPASLGLSPTIAKCLMPYLAVRLGSIATTCSQ